MAFVPYYNRRGYNDGLSKVAEAALLNIENEICDKVITEQILCKLIAEYKFDGGILEFSASNPFLDNGAINPNVRHYTFYNKCYQLGCFNLGLGDFRLSPELYEPYFKSLLMKIIKSSLRNHVDSNPKFVDDFILNRINRASPEAPLPTLNLRIDTTVINATVNKFKESHEPHLVPTQPLYIPILNGKEHAPFWNISENDFKVNLELLKSQIKDFALGYRNLENFKCVGNNYEFY